MKTNDINVREALHITGTTRQQIYNLIINGAIKAVKVGRVYMIDRASVVAYTKRRNGKAA
jgi:excisionase family DNA binding protein